VFGNLVTKVNLLTAVFEASPASDTDRVEDEPYPGEASADASCLFNLRGFKAGN
jgi:hypothetical protein